MIIGVPDKLLVPWLKGKKYIAAADEGEAVGIGIGYYLATRKPAIVFMSADGFCNALNPLTSCVLPEKIKMNFVISTGRVEYQHIVMAQILQPLIKLLSYDPKKIHFRFVQKK